jgi:PAS domain-containing protein
MERDYRILYLEDREEDLKQVSDLLRREYVPVEITWIKGLKAFHSALKGGWGYDLLLVSDGLPDVPGHEALDLVHKRCPDLPVILLCSGAGRDSALRCLNQGAMDFVPKEDLSRLAPAVRRAFRSSRERAELRAAEAANTRLTSLLRTVLETTQEGVLVTDLAGRITTYNRKFMTLCGIPEYVLAPMELERVLQFFQDQFTDTAGFLREVRMLGDHAERRTLGMVGTRDARAIEAHGRAQGLGGETVGRIYTFADVTERERAADLPGEPAQVPPDLLEAARTGRVVPWYLTEDDLVISEKGLDVLGVGPGGLPKDLPALEALIHPADLDTFRQALEHPRTAILDLGLRKADGTWIRTRWTLKRGEEGYRGVFMALPQGAGAPQPASDLAGSR